MRQHLVHRVDLHFAFLKALQSEANGHMLSRLHEKGCVRVLRRNRGGQALQQLLYVEFSIGIGLSEFLLQLLGLHVGITANFPKSREQADSLDNFLFLQRHNSTRPACSGATVIGRSLATTSAHCGDTAHGHATWPTASTMRALRSSDELQQFLWIIQPLVEFRTESLGGNLRRDGYVARAWIGRDKSDFVDSDRSLFVVSKRVLDLFVS